MEINQDVALDSDDTLKTAVKQTPPPSGKMDRSLISSLAWNAGSDWISQILTWASFLTVMRLLTPADFGIVAMSASLMPFWAYIAGFGIPRAIVALRDLTEDHLRQLNSTVLLLGFASFGLAALLAKPFAMFYKTPRLAPVLIVSSLGLIVGGAQSVSNSLLVRDRRFKTLSVYGAIAAVLSAILTLLMAFLGWGYWSLILGNLIAGTFRSVLVIKTRPQGYAMPRFSSVQGPLKFGRYVLVSLLAWNLYQRLDNITAGRMLGGSALGLYGMAWTLANVPLEKVTSLVTVVVPSYLVAVQDDLAEVRRYIRNLTESMALITFPACVGLGIVASEFVPLVLGHKWDGAVAPLQVLSIYTAFRSIVALLPKLLTVLNEPRFVMWNDLATLAVLGAAFVTGSHWGIAGIAWAWVLAYPLVVLPLYRKALGKINMSSGEYLRSLRPALEATIVMTLAVECVKYELSGRSTGIVRLVVEVAAGAACYTATLFLWHRQRMTTLMQMAKRLRHG